MTNEQKIKAERRIKTLKDRKHGLASLPYDAYAASTLKSIFEDIEKEINIELDFLEKKVKTKEEWLFGFKGGGWNSVYAITREEAIKLADEKYAEDRASGCLIPDHKTFRVSTPSDYQNLLSLFY